MPWGRDGLPTPIFLGFPGGVARKESACNVGDLGSISGLERSPGEGKGYPLQHSGLEKFHGRYRPWGHKELDTTEQPSLLKVAQETRSCVLPVGYFSACLFCESHCSKISFFQRGSFFLEQ